MTDVDTRPAGTPPVRRWLFPLLVASLALNLLVVGGMIGAKISHHKRFGAPGLHGADRGLMGFVRDLPEDRRTVIGDQIKKLRDGVKPLRQAVREAWDETNTVLTAEPFDKAKFEASLAKVSAAEDTFRAAVNSGFADTAAALTADERKQLYAWREKRKGRKRGKDKDDD